MSHLIRCCAFSFCVLCRLLGWTTVLLAEAVEMYEQMEGSSFSCFPFCLGFAITKPCRTSQFLRVTQNGTFRVPWRAL